MAPKGVVLLGFPSNDFGGQEPGTAEEIGQFCKRTYDVTFPLFEKVVTKAGAGPVPRLRLPRRIGEPPGVELQQVRRRQERQGRRVLPEPRRAGGPELRAALEKALGM